MKTVRITETIATEYMTRDIFPNAWDAGRNVVLDDHDFALMLEDAIYYADSIDGPDIPRPLRRSYAAHAKRLAAELVDEVRT